MQNKERLLRLGLRPLITTLLAAALLLIGYALAGLYPCGSRSLVWCDMEQQAVPILMQLREIAARGEPLGYSVLNAGGMQFYGVFFFFLSNPFSFLIFCTDVPADLLVGLLVLCKLALAAGTAALWFGARTPRLSPALQVLLGLMYGLSGYGLFYYQNLMWLDVMALLPLLLLGLRRLTKHQDARLYCVTLGLSVVLCFYLGYMLVLFVLLYTAAAVRFTVPAAQRPLTARRFWLASFLAAALTAFVWIPCFLQVMRSGRSGSIIENLMRSYLLNHLEDRLALLCCTAAIFAAVPWLFRAGTRRSAKARRDRLLFALLAAATLLDPVNCMWHTGSYQAFPYRWGMISILLLLTVLAGQLSAPRYPKEDCPHVSLAGRLLPFAVTAAVLTASALLFRFADPLMTSYASTLWVDGKNMLALAAFALLTALAYHLVLRGRYLRRMKRRTAAVLLCVLFAAEFPLHFRCYIGAAANDDALFGRTMALRESFPAEGDDLSRVRLTRKYAHANMLGALGQPTLAHYTSLTPERFLHGVKRMGYSSYWMEVPSFGGTVLSDAMWHVRYQLGTRRELSPWAPEIWTDGLYSLGSSTMLLPSAFYTDMQPDAIAALPMTARADVQRFLAAELGMPDPVTAYEPAILHGVTLTQQDGLTVCTAETEPDEETEFVGEIRYPLFISGRQALYFDLSSPTGTELFHDYDEAVKIRVNGTKAVEKYPVQQDNGLVYLGTFQDCYCTVSVLVRQGFSCESFGVFGIDLDTAEQGITEAAGETLHYSRGVYTAECETEAPRLLVLSAAYEAGLHAAVDGVSVPVYCVNDCMAAVEIPAGQHSLTVRFRVPGLTAGLCLGAVGCLAAVWLWLRRRKAGQTAPGKLWLRGLTWSFAAVVGVVYLLPLALWAAGCLWYLNL